MRPDYVVTTCGNRKYPGPMRADRFYLGPFVRKQGEVARALKPTRGRLILSNKYGFMDPGFVIPGPYDSHWGYSDSLSAEDLKRQLLDLNPEEWRMVTVLGGIDYARQTRLTLPEKVKVIWPPKHLPDRRIGNQMRLYSQITRLGHLPSKCLRECGLTLSEV